MGLLLKRWLKLTVGGVGFVVGAVGRGLVLGNGVVVVVVVEVERVVVVGSVQFTPVETHLSACRTEREHL